MIRARSLAVNGRYEAAWPARAAASDASSCSTRTVRILSSKWLKTKGTFPSTCTSSSVMVMSAVIALVMTVTPTLAARSPFHTMVGEYGDNLVRFAAYAPLIASRTRSRSVNPCFKVRLATATHYIPVHPAHLPPGGFQSPFETHGAWRLPRTGVERFFAVS